MSQQWIYGNVLLLIAVLMIMLFTTYELFPDIALFYALATTSFFVVAGIVMLSFAFVLVRKSSQVF